MTSLRHIALIFFAALLFTSCEKNTNSKIPYISLLAFEPDTAMKANLDTCFFYFSIVDGDADIAGISDSVSQIYLTDSRDTNTTYKIPFPDVDVSVQDPKKGLEGKCFFYPIPQPVPRSDSLHMTTGDTLYYAFYIKDRAGHKSNVVTTPVFYVRP